MKSSILLSGLGLCAALALSACGDPAPTPPATPDAPTETAEAGTKAEAEPQTAPEDDAPIVVEAAKSMPPAQRQLTPEEQKQVVDQIMQVRARQQAEGLGSGTVKVNKAWIYTGYSEISPDPASAIEARLVAVDVTISGHTPYFDIDDIEIVDGTTQLSYGSDPFATPLRADGQPMVDGDEMPVAPAASRWLLVYAFPKDSPKFLLYYWGKALTPNPVGFEPGGLSLPYPPAE